MSSFDRRLRRYAVLTVPQSLLVVLLVTGVLAFNETLDATERRRWRIAFYLVPPSIALYWWREVRTRTRTRRTASPIAAYVVAARRLPGEVLSCAGASRC